MAATTLLLLAPGVWAHGFGQRYDLPVPLWLWLTGAALSVVLSFAVVIDFLPRRLAAVDYPRLRLREFRVARWLMHAYTVAAGRTLVLLLFLLTIAAGLWGTPDAERNLAPTMVWVIGWVGVGFVCALIGDLWAVVHPLRTLYALGVRLRRSWATPWLPYPAALGAWPAVVILLAFAWSEHLAHGAAVPFNLGVALIAYSLFTLFGMRVFGADLWLQNAEAFSVAFAVFGRFAPLELRVTRDATAVPCASPVCPATPTGCANGRVCLAKIQATRREFNLRLPATGLLNDRHVSFSLQVFVLILLAGVTFDGFIETPLWASTQDRAATWASPMMDALSTASGLDRTELIASLALLLFPLGFLIAFLLCCALMAALGLNAGRTGLWPGTRACAARFVLTLVPIAIAYHLAHYLSLLVNAGQLAIPLLSDPFGRGWDVFGTAAYAVDPSVLGVRTVWTLIVVSIVLGHMLSVYLAHVVALDLVGDRAAAIRAELPLLVLMVGYTMASLWILAQPIVG